MSIRSLLNDGDVVALSNQEGSKGKSGDPGSSN
jgi:hypothetical protein